LENRIAVDASRLVFLDTIAAFQFLSAMFTTSTSQIPRAFAEISAERQTANFLPQCFQREVSQNGPGLETLSH
jgi:hypothetical protein